MILLNPGPVTLTDRVRKAMGNAPDMCHREPEFNDLLQRVRSKILKVYDLSQKMTELGKKHILEFNNDKIAESGLKQMLSKENN